MLRHGSRGNHPLDAKAAPRSNFNRTDGASKVSAEAPRTPWHRASKSRRSERQAASSEGGKVQPASGALRRTRSKGDVVARGSLIEDKVTDAKSFTIKVSDLEKTNHEAFRQGLLPQWRVTLPGHKLRLLREEDYLYLAAKAEKIDG